MFKFEGAPNVFLPSFPIPSESEGTPESKIAGSPQIPRESEGTAVPPISKKSDGRAKNLQNGGPILNSTKDYSYDTKNESLPRSWKKKINKALRSRTS